MQMLFGCSELVTGHYQSMVADHLALISCYPRDPRDMDEHKVWLRQALECRWQ